MTKIGTVHIEVKPVLNAEAMDAIAEQIEAKVRAAIEAGVLDAR